MKPVPQTKSRTLFRSIFEATMYTNSILQTGTSKASPEKASQTQTGRRQGSEKTTMPTVAFKVCEIEMPLSEN